jgi:hypothetical protein
MNLKFNSVGVAISLSNHMSAFFAAQAYCLVSTKLGLLQCYFDSNHSALFHILKVVLKKRQKFSSNYQVGNLWKIRFEELLELFF